MERFEFDGYSDENLQAVAEWEASMRPGCPIDGCDCGNPDHVDPPRTRTPARDTRHEQSAAHAAMLDSRRWRARVALNRVLRRFR